MTELHDAMDTKKYEKLESYSRIHEAEKKAVGALPEEQKKEGSALFERLQERIFRDQMLKDIEHPYAEGRPVYDVTFENVQAGELVAN